MNREFHLLPKGLYVTLRISSLCNFLELFQGW
jgi:hypothetical protein